MSVRVGALNLRIAMRSYLSTHHLHFSRYFIAQSARIEEQFAKDGDDRLWSTQRAYVVGSVLSSVAFLESAIIEVYRDIADGYRSGGLSKQRLAALKAIWISGGINRVGVLDKYAAAWTVLKKSSFPRDTGHYQRAQLAIALRNSLVHFEPQTLGEGLPPHKLEHALKSQFSPSSFMKNKGNPYFPDHCLGHGCAAWCLASCKDLADHFFKSVRLSPNYLQIEKAEKLRTRRRRSTGIRSGAAPKAKA